MCYHVIIITFPLQVYFVHVFILYLSCHILWHFLWIRYIPHFKTHVSSSSSLKYSSLLYRLLTHSLPLSHMTKNGSMNGAVLVIMTESQHYIVCNIKITCTGGQNHQKEQAANMLKQKDPKENTNTSYSTNTFNTNSWNVVWDHRCTLQYPT